MNDRRGDGGVLPEAFLSRVVIRDTLPAADGHGGAGVACGGRLTLVSSLVTNSRELGVVIGNPGSSAVVKGSVVTNTAVATDGRFGHGVVGLNGASVVIDDTEVAGNQIGIAFDRSAAVVRSSLVRGNQVGIHVQGGVALEEAASVPDAPVEGRVLVSQSSQFVGNQARTGTGVVPLPSNPVPK